MSKEQTAVITRTRGPRGVPDTAIITVLADANPKRAGSKAAAAFDHYEDGMTVAEYCNAAGKPATPNLVYDAAHGFIEIEGYTPGVVEVKAKKVRPPKKAKKAKVDEYAEMEEDELEAA